MKELLELKSKLASNRIDIETITHPCPEDKQNYIEEAFRYFNMLG